MSTSKEGKKMPGLQPRIVPADSDSEKEYFLEKFKMQLAGSIASRADPSERSSFILLLSQNFGVGYTWIQSQFNLWQYQQGSDK